MSSRQHRDRARGAKAEGLDPEVEKVWREFWADIAAPGGVLDLAQVKKELFDFHTAIDNVPKVYRHITGDRMSKITYPASTVIAAADDHWNESLEDERKEWEPEAPREGGGLDVPESLYAEYYK